MTDKIYLLETHVSSGSWWLWYGIYAGDHGLKMICSDKGKPIDIGHTSWAWSNMDVSKDDEDCNDYTYNMLTYDEYFILAI